MRVTLRYDRSVDAWTIGHEGVRLASVDDVAEWRSQLLVQLEKKLRGKKSWILVDMVGFDLEPAMAPDYGAVAKAVVGTYALGIIRYGNPTGSTRAQVRLEAVIHNVPANVYADRAAAVAVLKRLRGTATAGAEKLR
jgi:hypothetical protein